MNQRKIIMDTDIGSDIDDALCLAYLLKQPSCDLVGITTCSSEPEKRAELADSICRYMGSEIPIYPGRDTPLIGKQLQVAVHQYEAAKPFPHRSVFPTHRAIDFMREIIEAHPHQITLLAIGPLTNIGALLSAYPHLAPLIPEISVMGGSFFEEAVSFIPIEWNIKNDPTAARIVFDSGIPTRVVGLDVTLKLKIQCTDFIGMSHSDNLKPVIKNAQKFLDRTNDMYFHDPLAAVCLFDESVCTFQRGQITVGIGRDDWGRTCFEETPSGSVCVAVDVDQDQFYRHYFGMIGSGNETM